jgi:hypothetical protein
MRALAKQGQLHSSPPRGTDDTLTPSGAALISAWLAVLSCMMCRLRIVHEKNLGWLVLPWQDQRPFFDISLHSWGTTIAASTRRRTIFWRRQHSFM